jgi:hypothetical protein
MTAGAAKRNLECAFRGAEHTDNESRARALVPSSLLFGLLPACEDTAETRFHEAASGAKMCVLVHS